MTIQASQMSSVVSSNSTIATAISKVQAGASTGEEELAAVSSSETSSTSSSSSTSSLSNEEKAYDLDDNGELSNAERAAYLRAMEAAQNNASKVSDISEQTEIMEVMKQGSSPKQAELQNQEVNSNIEQEEASAEIDSQSSMASIASKAYMQFKEFEKEASNFSTVL